MSDEKFTPEESLQVIQLMILKAKQNVANNSFYFLLWGWLVFSAAIINFALIKFTDFKMPYLAWNLMIIGIVASIMKGIKESKKESVKTYLGETMRYFGMSTGIIYMGFAFIFGKFNLWLYSFPFYILIYAVACFFMGLMLQFSFLKWAGLFCLFIMAISVYLDQEWQLLLLALAVLIAYIIPGHILSAKEKLAANNV